MADWAVAVVAPNTEQRVARLLDIHSFPHHIFWQTVREVRRGRIRERFVPLFSRYAFILPQHIYEIKRRISDVYHTVVFGEQLALVDDNFIRTITDVASNGILPYAEPSPRFRRDDIIVVKGDGAFSGQQGVYQSVLRHGRALILVGWLNQLVPAEVDERDLELYTAPERRRHRGRRRRGNRHRGRQCERERGIGNVT